MIIGISGKIGSGKDTIGTIIQYLIDKNKAGYINPDSVDDYKSYLKINHNLTSYWKIKKFAYKLKQCVSIITGILIEDLEKEEVKNSYLGNEWNIINKNWNNIKFIEELYNCKIRKETFDEYLNKNYEKISEDVYRYINIDTILTVRTLLQQLGTEVGRVIHPNFWVNALFSEYDKFENIDSYDCKTGLKNCIKNHECHTCKEVIKTYKSNWIITDVRFPNEAKAVENRQGILIRVIRGIYPNDSINQQAHSSETALDNYNFKYVIDNNGTIEELIEEVKQILINEKII